MISEFLCVAFDCGKPEKKQTESGTRTAQSVVLADLDYDNAAA
jgi:hypothetical protein